MTSRQLVPQSSVDDAVEISVAHLKEVLRRKGFRSFKSTHEIYGVISEEFEELKRSLHNNDLSEFEGELLDIIAACLFSYACIRDKTLDW